MAHAGTRSPARHLHARVSSADAQAGYTVRAQRGRERHTVFRIHSSCDRSVRDSFWSLRSRRQAGSHDYSDCSASRLFLSLALCAALVLPPSAETPILLIGPAVGII